MFIHIYIYICIYIYINTHPIRVEHGPMRLATGQFGERICIRIYVNTYK